jgi:hypothetical protein
MYKFFKKFIFFYIVWAIFYSLVNKANANEAQISLHGDNTILNIIQDGSNNFLDVNIYNNSNQTATYDFSQTGNNFTYTFSQTCSSSCGATVSQE